MKVFIHQLLKKRLLSVASFFCKLAFENYVNYIMKYVTILKVNMATFIMHLIK